jgi:branched-subunit amino acid transport protein AzlD
MLSIREALIQTVVMGLVILSCRALPFFLFREKGDPRRGKAQQSNPARFAPLLSLVEKAVPPAAMTVLAFNSISAPFKESLHLGIPALIAAGFTALVHLWKRNSLISIFGGVLVYLLLERFL